ncbi:MAG: AAA family ATPase [Pseudonocardiaceae bacterium]
MGRPGRFVGVGIDVYDSHEPLEHAVAEVRAVAELLRGEFAGEPLLDPDHAQVLNYLETLSGCPDTGPLVLLWCGHGVCSGSMLRLAARDAGREINAAEVIYHCVKSGANQLLFIVDTCQADTGVGAATAVASALLKEVPPDAEHVWFGILASCSEGDIGARDGVFGEALLRLLRHGPRSPDMQRRWSKHNRLIRGDDLGQALLEDWTDEDQRPDFLRRGSAWYMLPNPLWDEGAPEEVVEHLLLAARGGDSADHRSWFTGREAEVNQVVSWVAAGAPGVRVVTGSAGTGKSAIVGRVVSLSNPAERGRLEQGGARWAHADPGVQSVTAHVHARALTADRMAELLDGQLVRSGVLAPGDGDRRNAAELVGALQRAVQGGARPPVLVIDGLDEARGEMFTIAADLLVRLAPYTSLVVSTRPATRAEPATSLIEALQADAVLDLDDPVYRESGRVALRGYVVARLSGVAVEMDATAVADRLLGESSQIEDRPFLLARVVTDQLRAAPIDTSTPNWEQYLAHSIESAFDVDLARIAPPGMGLPPGTSPGGLARTMLTALTWAFGAGFPEEEWIAVASRLVGVGLGRDHVSWVLDGLGRYVVQGGEGGIAVYRVAHQSLADHLRPSYRRTGERPFDPAAEAVWAALAARYAALMTSGHPAVAPTYLWRYAYRHAAAVGVGGLPALRELASAADELQPDIALAALEVAGVLATWGRRVEAVAPTEEAVALRRNLAADNPAYAPDLAMALNNLGVCYREVGRRAEAVAPTEEAVALRREQAADNPAYAPDLAAALSNLDRHLVAIGDATRAEAVWQQVLSEHDPLTRSTLLLHRASAADLGDPRAAGWLVEACRSDDRGLLGPAHDSARTHRAANPDSWDTAWTQASGAAPPEWLTVDTDLFVVATAWLNTPTYADERDHLAAHPELLDPQADTAIDEALLRVDENDADRYRQLRAHAQAEGVDAAYRPLFLLLLAEQFSAANPAGQRELLTQRHPELLDDLVRHYLDSRSGADETGEVTRAVALLDIAKRDADGSILAATFDSLDHPNGFPELLDATARNTDSAATLLQPLATIALTAATTEPQAAVAGLYLAIAAAVAGDQDRATELISQALEWDPGSASTWIARLAQLAAVQPSVLFLITVLAETRHDDKH